MSPARSSWSSSMARMISQKSDAIMIESRSRGMLEAA